MSDSGSLSACDRMNFAELSPDKSKLRQQSEVAHSRSSSQRPSIGLSVRQFLESIWLFAQFFIAVWFSSSILR